MKIDLDALTREELDALYHQIVERLKMLDTLMKFNPKMATVITDDGQRWNISPQLLSPLKGVSSAKVIDISKKNR